MTTPSRGIIGIGLMALIAVAIVVALGGAYVVDTQYVQPRAQTATTTIDVTTHPPTATSTTSGTAGAGVQNDIRVVTGDDSDSVITLHPGDQFILKLGTDKNWTNVRIDNTDVVSAVETFAPIPDAQGMFEAHAKGTATLTANGAAICDPGMACPQFILMYKITIIVD